MDHPSPLSSFRVRPRFTQLDGRDRDTVRRDILGRLATHDAGLEIRAFHEFIGLHVPEKERRYWSPRLFLSLEPADGGGTRIEGTYGPEMEVWSVFLYGYLISGLLGTFSGIYGGAQLVIGSTPSAFWVTGAMATVAATLYVFAQLGQKLAAGQTFRLHEACRAALGETA